MQNICSKKFRGGSLGALALSLCLAGFLAISAASADENEWDQARVTEVAEATGLKAG